MSEFTDHISDRSFGLLGEEGEDSLSWVDYKEEVVTFPLWNLSGQMVGYQQYNWRMPKSRGNNPKEQKYYTHLPKGTIGVYGLDLLEEGYLGTIFLVEGIWEAFMGMCFGIPCIAVLGVGRKGVSKQTKLWLDTLPNVIVPLCQADEAGKGLAKIRPRHAITLSQDLDDCLRNSGWWGIPREVGDWVED